MGIDTQQDSQSSGSNMLCFPAGKSPKYMHISTSDIKRGSAEPFINLGNLNFVTKITQVSPNIWTGYHEGFTVDVNLNTLGVSNVFVYFTVGIRAIFSDSTQPPCSFYFVNHGTPANHGYGGVAGLSWVTPP